MYCYKPRLNRCLYLSQSRSILYKFRLLSPAVSCKPPALPVGMNALWAWFVATLTVSDTDLLASCGLDGLMFVKMFTLGGGGVSHACVSWD